MTEEPSFADFIRRIRAGDADAAVALVRQYEQAIRMEVRMRLSDPRLRRTFDSMDVCQSVLGSFFVRAAAGQFDLEDPSSLIRLLVVMARKKLASHARQERAQRRDNRRTQGIDAEVFDPAANGPTPSKIVEGEELLRKFRERLTAEEQQLAERRAQSGTWEEIAAELGGTPQARRKQLERAIDRVARDLGLDE